MMSSCPATYPEYRTVEGAGTAPKANRAEGSSMCSGNHKITSYHDLQQKQGWDSRAGCEIGVVKTLLKKPSLMPLSYLIALF